MNNDPNAIEPASPAPRRVLSELIPQSPTGRNKASSHGGTAGPASNPDGVSAFRSASSMRMNASNTFNHPSSPLGGGRTNRAAASNASPTFAANTSFEPAHGLGAHQQVSQSTFARNGNYSMAGSPIGMAGSGVGGGVSIGASPPSVVIYDSKSRFTGAGGAGGGGGGTVAASIATSNTSGTRTRKSEAVATVQQAAMNGYVSTRHNNADGKSTGRPPFTLPLSIVLLMQCSLVVAAFVAIVVVADVIANNTATDLIRHSVDTELKYAATQIDGPISSIESGIIEYRSRHMAYTYINEGVEPCNQFYGGFQNSSDFYANAIQAINNNPYISHVFYVKESFGIDPEFNMTNLNRCSASGSQFFRRFNGYSMKAARAPKLADFENLDAIPLNPDSSTKQMTQIYLGLTARRVTWAPLSSEDPRSTDFIFTLVLTAPMHYNVTDSTTGEEKTYNYLQINPDYLADGADLRYPHLDIRTVGIICMTIRMTNYPAIMTSITPVYEGAHSSLYDLKRDMMLATSFYDMRNQLNYVNGDHFVAGATPSAELNEAFRVANPRTMRKGEVRILFGKKNVVSAYLYARPETSVNFAFVQSTPRDNYFAPMKTLRTIMIILGICSAVLVVAACLLVGISISIGGKAVILNMGLAAAMRNDRTIRITSVLREIQQLSDGFDAMNDRLLEARAYLPQHMLVTSSDDDDNEGNGDEDDEASNREASRGRGDGTSLVGRRQVSYSADMGTTAASNTLDTPTNTTNNAIHRVGGNNAVEMKGVGGGLGAPMVGGLALKRVTVLSVNVRGFHGMVNPTAPSTVGEPTSSLTELIADLANSYRGVIDAFHGDHFVLTFNAARPNAEGHSKASRCALEVAAVGDHSGRLFAMGISSGRACVGNLGSATLKRLSIIGPVYSKAMALSRLCRKFNPSLDVDPSTEDGFLPIQCVIDVPVVTEIQHSFVLQLLGGLYGAPFIPAKSASAPTVNLASLSLRQPGGRGGQLNDDANFVSASAFNNNTNRTAATKNAGLSPTHANGQQQQQPAQPMPPLEFVYALRKASATSKGDEWLYELSNSNTSKVNDVNRAVKEYLVDVHTQEVTNVRARRGSRTADGCTTTTAAAAAEFGTVVTVEKSAEHSTTSASVSRVPSMSMVGVPAPWRVEAAGRLLQRLQQLRQEGEGTIASPALMGAAAGKETSVPPAAAAVPPIEDPLFWEALKYGTALCGQRMPIPAIVLSNLGIISQSDLNLMGGGGGPYSASNNVQAFGNTSASANAVGFAAVAGGGSAQHVAVVPASAPTSLHFTAALFGLNGPNAPGGAWFEPSACPNLASASGGLFAAAGQPCAAAVPRGFFSVS